VPNGSTVDMTSAIEAQVERFAPGFGRRTLARSTRNASEMAAYNPNYVGGDINGGVQDVLQLWTRPVARPDPYATPNARLFICSSATPPGGGVHGMCGFYAARSALRRGLLAARRG
jgi:phytoene dehydrogenase-like protein